MPTAETAQCIAFVCMMVFTVVALLLDVRDKKIPNVVTVPVFVAGLLFNVIVGFGLLFALKGFAVGFGLLLLLWLVGGSGGGDVKFMGALGVWLGAWLTFQVLVVSSLLGGLLTALILTPKVFQMKQLSSKKPEAENQRSRKKKEGPAKKWSLHTGTGWRIPFALPTAVATWIVLILFWAGYVLKDWPLIHR